MRGGGGGGGGKGVAWGCWNGIGLDGGGRSGSGEVRVHGGEIGVNEGVGEV